MNEIALSIILVTLLILLLIAGIAISFFLANQQRMRQERLLSETKTNFERELRQVEQEVSEHVMGQFARELHDNIGQTLTSMNFEIENRKHDHPEHKEGYNTIQIYLARFCSISAIVWWLLPSKFEGYNTIQIYLAEATKQLRLLSRTLNNDFIGHSGLYGAIQLEVDRLNALRRFVVNLKMDAGVSTLEKDQELMVFRIVQEIAQNALKHSEAKQLSITLQSEPFELTVADDGKGFDYEAVINSNKASGLRNILKRAELAALNCTIQTKLGEGTTYILKKVQL